MESFYLDIRSIHIGTVIVSGLLFFLRAAGHNLMGARWPMAMPLRIVVWATDTTLLTAAFMLMTITHQAPFVTDWLTVKVLLLCVYVAVAWTAFRATSRQVRIACTFAGAALFAFVFTIARAHDPLGFLA